MNFSLSFGKTIFHDDKPAEDTGLQQHHWLLRLLRFPPLASTDLSRLILLCTALFLISPSALGSQSDASGLREFRRAPVPDDGEIQALIGEDGRFLNAPITVSQADSIGLMLSQALEEFGLPLRMYPLRGEVEWQDDIVFFYRDYRYLYWYDDRLWQIRFDRRYESEVGGVRPGMNREEIESVLGIPHYQGEGNLYYDLVDRGFPLRFRLVLDEGILTDLYLYRSDF